ncbi:MAG TPA: hypothetical protein VJL27_01700 [Patescibacteria group bacterium]|nr:hypothetical protein [Patescibacteria group bacterium]
MSEQVPFLPKMGERVTFSPKRTCDCSLVRYGYAGAISHQPPCEQQGVEWLAQSGDSITPGKWYRWINNDDEWCRVRGYEKTNVVAEVTRVNEAGMVFAYWPDDRPQDDQYGIETCIPNSAVVELVDNLPERETETAKS